MLRFLSIIPLSALFILASHGYAQDADRSRARVLASPPVLREGVDYTCRARAKRARSHGRRNYAGR